MTDSWLSRSWYDEAYGDCLIANIATLKHRERGMRLAPLIAPLRHDAVDRYAVLRERTVKEVKSTVDLASTLSILMGEGLRQRSN